MDEALHRQMKQPPRKITTEEKIEAVATCLMMCEENLMPHEYKALQAVKKDLQRELAREWGQFQ